MTRVLPSHYSYPLKSHWILIVLFLPTLIVWKGKHTKYRENTQNFLFLSQFGFGWKKAVWKREKENIRKEYWWGMCLRHFLSLAFLSNFFLIFRLFSSQYEDWSLYSTCSYSLFNSLWFNTDIFCSWNCPVDLVVWLGLQKFRFGLANKSGLTGQHSPLSLALYPHRKGHIPCAMPVKN